MTLIKLKQTIENLIKKTRTPTPPPHTQKNDLLRLSYRTTSNLSLLVLKSFSFFLARLIAVASTVCTCLVCNSSIMATCPSIPAARFAFRLFYSFFFLFVVVVSGEPRQKQGRGLVDHKLVQASSNFYCWPSQGGSSVLVLWWFYMWRVVIYGYLRYI